VDVSIGDPCVYDDFRPNKELLKAVSDSVDANNGYVDFEGIKVLFNLGYSRMDFKAIQVGIRH